jgi:hypothetical protein
MVRTMATRGIRSMVSDFFLSVVMLETLTRKQQNILRHKHDQIDAHFTFTCNLLRFNVSTCFGHYSSILRRYYTDAELVTIPTS